MDTLQLIKEIYTEGFSNLGHRMVKNSLKAFAWFGFSMYGMVLFAFVFRVSTGFAFD